MPPENEKVIAVNIQLLDLIEDVEHKSREEAAQVHESDTGPDRNPGCEIR